MLTLFSVAFGANLTAFPVSVCSLPVCRSTTGGLCTLESHTEVSDSGESSSVGSAHCTTWMKILESVSTGAHLVLAVTLPRSNPGPGQRYFSGVLLARVPPPIRLIAPTAFGALKS